MKNNFESLNAALGFVKKQEQRGYAAQILIFNGTAALVETTAPGINPRRYREYKVFGGNNNASNEHKNQSSGRGSRRK